MSEFDGENVRAFQMKKTKDVNEYVFLSEEPEVIDTTGIQEIKLVELFDKWVSLMFHE